MQEWGKEVRSMSEDKPVSEAEAGVPEPHVVRDSLYTTGDTREDREAPLSEAEAGVPEQNAVKHSQRQAGNEPEGLEVGKDGIARRKEP
jgi:hypothetical protein